MYTYEIALDWTRLSRDKVKGKLAIIFSLK